jgi:hypothetical protein
MRRVLRKAVIHKVGAVFCEALSINESSSISNMLEIIVDISWKEDRRKFEV